MKNELETTVIKGDETIAKKDILLERINKRDKDRKNYIDVKLEQRTKESLQGEGIDYFAQTFTQRAHEIEAKIKATSMPENSAGDAPAHDLGKAFADITVQIQELQRYLTTSTMFLTDFKIKACQNMLNDLGNSCDEARRELMPKKKFGFSGKKVATKPTNPISQIIDKLDAPEKDKQRTNAFEWTLSNLSNAHVCLSAAEVNGKDITISNMHNCFIELQGHAGSVQISKAVDCTFLCGPTSRSLFAEHCQNSIIAIACQQLRLHSSTGLRIYLHVTCRAIIEDCRQIEIAIYNYDYPSIEADWRDAGLDKSLNNYTDIADFDWLSPDVHSPNWKLLKDYPDPSWSELRDNFQQKFIDNSVL